MTRDPMLDVFNNLIKESDRPLLVSFKRNIDNNFEDSPPITEVLEDDYHGQIRKFEFDSSKCQGIQSYYNLPSLESAAIFEDNKDPKVYFGSKNVRNYLRILSQKN